MTHRNWKRNAMMASALATALALTACGQAGEDSAVVSRSDPRPAPTANDPSPTMPGDRMTADASSAMNRAGDAANRARDTAADATGRTADATGRTSDGVADTARKAESAAGDAALTARVKTKLMAEPGIDSLNINVDTKASTVTLRGEVDTPEHRAKAKEIASNTEGVVEVIDQLQVKQ